MNLKKRKKKKWFSRLIFFSIIIALGLYGWKKFTEPPEKVKKVEADMLYKVVKSDMILGVLCSGSLSSKKNYQISSKMGISAKIAWLEKENTHVKKGDFLVKFEKDDLIKDLEDKKLEYDNSEKELEIAYEELDVLKSTNAANLRQTEDSVQEADDALKKYLKYEGPKAKDDQLMSVEDALKAYEISQTDHANAINTHNNTVYDSEDKQAQAVKNIENLAKAIEQKEILYNNSILNRKIFKRYDYPSRINRLENSLMQAQLNLQKSKISCESSLVQKNNHIINLKNRVARNKSNYEKVQEYLTQVEIVAPVEGVVIYGDPTNPYDNIKEELKVGKDVYRNQTLMTIPDFSSMLVNFDLPEQYRSRVDVENDVIITPESIKTLKVRGKVSKIDPLPVNQVHWDRNSPKVYKTEAEFLSDDKRLLSGMSSQIEIISKVLEKVVAVPAEAIFEDKGEYFIYVYEDDKPVRKNVEIGAANEMQVEIKKGIKSGQIIYLFNPYIGDN